MRQDRDFRRNFRVEFVLMAVLIVGLIIVGIIVWSPWEDDQATAVPALPTPELQGTPNPTP